MYPRIPWELVKAHDCVESVLGKDRCQKMFWLKGQNKYTGKKEVAWPEEDSKSAHA